MRTQTHNMITIPFRLRFAARVNMHIYGSLWWLFDYFMLCFYGPPHCTVYAIASLNYKIHYSLVKTRYMEKKSIPMIALWCPTFSNHG